MRNRLDRFIPDGVTLSEGRQEDFAGSRIIKGRITKLRYKLIKRSIAKRNRALDEEYRQGRCGHDHDCCGCIIGEWYELAFVGKTAVILYFQSRNF